MPSALDEPSLDHLFTKARTANGFLPEPVPESTLRRLYELLKFAPTSANCSPARFVFVRSPEARERLLACMALGNVEKTRSAPVSVVIGMDLDFPETLPRLFPHADARSWFAGQPALIEATAFRNGSLQGAYLMLAARALGLDVGPMSGFDADRVNATFFAGTSVKVNFICNLGLADPAKTFPRSPRLAFEEACRIE